MRRRGYLCTRNLSTKRAVQPSNFRRREHRLSALKNRSFSMSPSMSHVRSKHGAALAARAFPVDARMQRCAPRKSRRPAAKAEDPAAVHPEIWPSPKWPFAKDAALEEKVAALLKKMTVEEKVGQVIQGDIASITPEDMKKYHLGSILAGGGSSPGNDERAPPAKEWLELADEFYAASVDTSNGGVGIPMIWGIDAMHGHSNIVGAVLFPHNVGLGATHNPKLLADIARVTAEQVRTTGIEWTFAPTVTVPQDDRWGRAYEGYSEDPGRRGLVRRRVRARACRAIPAAPDFLRGHARDLLDQALPRRRRHRERPRPGRREDPGDRAARHPQRGLRAGDRSRRADHHDLVLELERRRSITGNKGLITDVLKKRMNFDGFTVGDWNAHGQVEGCTNDNCPQALNAGLDMYMAPDTWSGLYENTLKQVKDGTIPMERLDDAVTRILRVKFRAGLFEAGPPSKRPLARRLQDAGLARAARARARGRAPVAGAAQEQRRPAAARG